MNDAAPLNVDPVGFNSLINGRFFHFHSSIEPIVFLLQDDRFLRFFFVASNIVVFVCCLLTLPAGSLFTARSDHAEAGRVLYGGLETLPQDIFGAVLRDQ